MSATELNDEVIKVVFLDQHKLNERFDVITSYLEMLRSIKQLTVEMQGLVTKAAAVVIPDDVTIPNPDPLP